EIGIDPEKFMDGEYALKAPVLDAQGEFMPFVAPKGRRLPPARHLFRAVGCNHCHGSGYSGRTGIYEVLTIS
ncbi:MAG: type II secretion system protein GspE, partial [Nannocystaceae bacterium]